jgi:hypothetical protein
VASIEEQPSLTLTEWKVVEIDVGTRHFVGYNAEGREGRVSTAIVSFDPATGKGRTASGRVYQIEGRPGLNGDAVYVWDAWCLVNSVKSFVDVTASVMSTRQ